MPIKVIKSDKYYQHGYDDVFCTSVVKSRQSLASIVIMLAFVLVGLACVVSPIIATAMVAGH